MRKKVNVKAAKRAKPEERPEYRTVLVRSDLYTKLLKACSMQTPTMGPNVYLENLLAEHFEFLFADPPAGRKM